MKYCVVRCDRSGVLAGNVVSQEGSVVKLKNARKLWYWDGAAAVEQISVDGVKLPENCKFTVVVDEMTVTDAIQIIPCSKEAEKIIKGVKEWKA